MAGIPVVGQLRGGFEILNIKTIDNSFCFHPQMMLNGPYYFIVGVQGQKVTV